MRYERFRMLAFGFSLVVRVLVTGVEGEDPTPRVVASCRDALGEDACAPASEGGDDDSVLRAVVRFSGEAVSVELTRPGAEPKTRSLEFLAGDGPEQRYRAAGLLVAAWAASEPRPPRVEPPFIGEVEGRFVELELLPTRRRFSVDVGAAGTSLWDRGDWGFGGELRASLLGDSWGFTSALGLYRAVGTAPTWSGRVGLGGIFELLPPSSGFSWWLLAEGVVERLDVSVAASSDGESRVAWRVGAKLESRWAWSEAWCRPWLGISGGWMAPPVEVELAGRPVVESSGWLLGFGAGVRFEFGAGVAALRAQGSFE